MRKWSCVSRIKLDQTHRLSRWNVLKCIEMWHLFKFRFLHDSMTQGFICFHSEVLKNDGSYWCCAMHGVSTDVFVGYRSISEWCLDNQLYGRMDYNQQLNNIICQFYKQLVIFNYMSYDFLSVSLDFKDVFVISFRTSMPCHLPQETPRISSATCRGTCARRAWNAEVGSAWPKLTSISPASHQHLTSISRASHEHFAMACCDKKKRLQAIWLGSPDQLCLHSVHALQQIILNSWHWHSMA